MLVFPTETLDLFIYILAFSPQEEKDWFTSRPEHLYYKTLKQIYNERSYR